MTYDLVSRYLSYEDYNERDEVENSNITQKLIKRINFFTDQFPFQIGKVERVVKSQKVFAFAYDNCFRLSFYIRPYFKLSQTEDKFRLDKIDIIVYIFFVMEFVQPLLKERFKFSEEINILVDFFDGLADTELIRYLIHYLTLNYPLLVNKIYLCNFQIDELRKNFSFLDEIQKEDKFNTIVYCEEGFQINLIQHFNPNCLPIEYGGYRYVDLNFIPDELTLEDLAEYFLSLILIKSV